MVTTAWCVKCKAEREMVDPRKVETKTGKWRLAGVCKVCGSKMSTFIKMK